MVDRDLLELYNNLVNVDPDIPVGVTYSHHNRCLVFTQYGWRMDTSILSYYCKDLVKIKNTVILPKDMKDLLGTLNSLLISGQLKQDRILISPIKYGMEIYKSNPNNLSIGPVKLGTIKFVTSNSLIFRLVSRFKFKNIIGTVNR